MNRFRFLLLPLWLCMLGWTGPSHGADNALALMAEKPELSTFYQLVKIGGLQDALCTGTYTVFAPDNAAFESMTAQRLDELARHPDQLKAVLSYHLLAGRVTADAIEGSELAVTLQGSRLSLSKAGDFVTADEALVTAPDLGAGHSVIHVVDRVLEPRRK